MKSFYKLAAVAMVTACIAQTGYSEKVPHVPGVVTEPTAVISPVIQDLSSNPLVVGNIEFDNFTPIFTTLTLNLVQDYRGALVGTVALDTNHADGGATFDIKGKIKLTSEGPSFKMKGVAPVTNKKGKTKKARLSVSATLIDFDAASLDPAIEDIKSTATYKVTIKVAGMGRNISFTSDAQLRGNYLFSYALAPEDQVKYLKQNASSDYYNVYTPWGVNRATGSFQIIGADGQFTIKAPKFTFIGIDYDYDGVAFDLDYGILKSTVGKTEGPFSGRPSQSAGPASAVKQANTDNTVGQRVFVLN